VRSVRWGKEIYDEVGRLSYPPANKVKEGGRCNAAGSSVFYCAGDIDTALAEQKDYVESGAYLGLGLWQTIEPILIIPLGFKFEEAKQEKLIPEYANYSKEDAYLFSLINKFFYEKSDRYYAQTQGISEHLLGIKFPENKWASTCVAFCYRSVAHPNEGKVKINYVFPADFVDKSMKLVSCEYHHVDEVTEVGILSTVLKQSSTFHEGTIKWFESGTKLKVDAATPYVQFSIPELGQEYQFHDQHGNIIKVPPRTLKTDFFD
jgi:hypothetical protein